MHGADLVELGPLAARPTDLLRLATVPVFVWAAYRDVLTRRVDSLLWAPLSALGIGLLVVDLRAAYADPLHLGDVALVWSAIGIAWLVAVALLVHYVGGFGGADARALMTIAVLFPLFPELRVAGVDLPLYGGAGSVEAFSFVVLLNAVVWSAVYPLLVAAGNAVRGHVGRAMFVGLPTPTAELDRTHGKLLERRGHESLLDRLYTVLVPRRRGLDLDALRMYLRWRGLTLEELLAEPERLRDPATLPADPNPPTDGVIWDEERRAAAEWTDGGSVEGAAASPAASDESSTDTDGAGADALAEEDPGAETEAASAAPDDDPWGAEAFLEDIEGDAYGTTPETLRHGLSVIAERDVVWVSPGIPLLVPVALGLVASFVVGDTVSLLLGAVGVA